jgi:hypothetical protein
VIEGFEDPTFPLFAAVQWHPERLIDDPEHLAVFKLLIDASVLVQPKLSESARRAITALIGQRPK